MSGNSRNNSALQRSLHSKTTWIALHQSIECAWSHMDIHSVLYLIDHAFTDGHDYVKIKIEITLATDERNIFIEEIMNWIWNYLTFCEFEHDVIDWKYNIVTKYCTVAMEYQMKFHHIIDCNSHEKNQHNQLKSDSVTCHLNLVTQNPKHDFQFFLFIWYAYS